jgi:hypothetical protein
MAVTASPSGERHCALFGNIGDQAPVGVAVMMRRAVRPSPCVIESTSGA